MSLPDQRTIKLTLAFAVAYIFHRLRSRLHLLVSLAVKMQALILAPGKGVPFGEVP